MKPLKTILLSLAAGVPAIAASAADHSHNAVSPVRLIVGDDNSRVTDEVAQPAGAGTGFRTIDGSGNNLAQPSMGAADTPLARWTTPAYADGIEQMAMPAGVAARAVSNALFDQRRSFANPHAASDFLWQWGQFLDHDIDLTDGVTPAEPAPMPIPSGDPWFDPDGAGDVTLYFNRSIYMADSGTGVDNPRQQVNQITAWIDGSNIYGSNATRAAALRRLDGSGQLATSDGDLLPYNVAQLPNAGGSSGDLFLGGDVRANEQVGLTAVHTLFLREHNRLAAQIAVDEPGLDGEQIYLRARRLVIAQLQAITYREFLPLLLGADAIAPYTGYQDTLDASIANLFSTAAYRLGHSMLSPRLLRLDATGAPIDFGHLSLRDAFFAPHRLRDEGGIEPLLRGLAAQVCQTIDAQVVDDVRNFLFGAPGAGGFDLVSLNIQRGRDHGLPRYNAVRTAMGLETYTDFAQITPDTNLAAALSSVYANVDEIDLWVGVLAEAHVADAMVGELARHLLAAQFTKLRDGDRFWYENVLSVDELAWVQASRLSDVIRRNTSIDQEISDNVFIVAAPANLDGDSVADPWDNCTTYINDDQRDTDNDGYGNRCDADLNNDGIVNAGDLGAFKIVFGTNDANADFNGDGNVNAQDLGLLRQLFFRAPGPSGQVL
jgi:hypothetical protein